MLWLLLASSAALVLLFSGWIAVSHASGSASQSIRRFTLSAAANAVPLGYSLFMSLFLFLFDRNCLPEIHSAAHRFFIRVNYVPPFLSMALMYLSDPGKITRANHARAIRMFPWDRILFLPGNECRTCLFEKPARSRHCPACKACVAGCDHHCVWVNNCVGINNARWFLLFLVSHVWFFLYGLILNGFLVWSHSYPPLSTWWSPLAWWDLSWSIVRSGDSIRTAFCCVILCGFLLCITLLFAVSHLRLVYLGVTTNESDKWQDVHWAMTEGILYTYNPGGGHIILQRLSNGRWNRSLSSDEMAWVTSSNATLEPVTSWDDIVNIYDHGFVSNLKLALFPPPL